MLLNFAREPLLGLDGVRRASGVGVLSAEQKRALDVLEEVAARNQVRVRARAGDVLFVNNHAVLHSREGFVDGGERPRYLVRMWLRNPELAWGLPPGPLREGNERIYGEDSCSGPGGEGVWNVVDAPRVRFRLSERLTS